MYGCIWGQNRSVATLAISTLLKTGNEESVETLMKQISKFMAEIPDDFKVVVVDDIRELCLKFPSKQVSAHVDFCKKEKRKRKRKKRKKYRGNESGKEEKRSKKRTKKKERKKTTTKKKNTSNNENMQGATGSME